MGNAIDLADMMRKTWTGKGWTDSYLAKIKMRVANNNSIINASGRVIVAVAVAKSVNGAILEGHAIEQKTLRPKNPLTK